jgi:hypothetical protein
MPPRHPRRDLFAHKWERVATGWANLEALSQPDQNRLEAILRSVAKRFSNSRVRVSASHLTGRALRHVGPDDCAKAAANNLRKLVEERSELDQLSQADRQTLETKLRDLSAICRTFRSQLSVSEAPRERLREATNLFASIFPPSNQQPSATPVLATTYMSGSGKAPTERASTQAQQLFDRMQGAAIAAGRYKVIWSSKINKSGDRVLARRAFESDKVIWYYKRGSLIDMAVDHREVDRISRARAVELLDEVLRYSGSATSEKSTHEIRWRYY